MTKDKTKENVERPNKSQIKRDMQVLFEQAAYICELKAEKINRLELHPAVLSAIDELKRIKDANPRKRHIQYITRLLSEQPNLEDIHNILFEYQNPHLLQQQIDRKVDQLIAKLLDGEQSVIDELLSRPQLQDRQNFLQILRNAQKEHQQAKADELSKTEQGEAPLKAPDGKQLKKFKKVLRELLKS